jgi:hypothetical protein
MRKMALPIDTSLDVWIDRAELILTSKHAEAALEESVCFLCFASSLVRNFDENIRIYEQLLKLCCVFLHIDFKVFLVLINFAESLIL